MRQYLSQKVVHISPPQFLALSFAVIILLGTLLLKLPFATTAPLLWIDALFTAASATTVTGLVVVDTGGTFTVFGQVVIMVLIQIGGLGLMTFAVLIFIIFGKKIGLKQRLIVQEALNATSIGGLIRLIRTLSIFALFIEGIASLILAIQWVPEYGWAFGLYTSLFHAVSAFNNAGFSLWDDSLTQYVGHPLINIVISVCFIIGGIGFTVIADLAGKRKFKNLSLHSKLMITGTFTVNIIVMLCFFLLEFNNSASIGNLPLNEKMWASYFQAVTPRTAGFNSVEIGELRQDTIMIMILLMFIGAGSGSTGSGIKLTTFLVMVLACIAFLKGQEEPVVFKRAIRQHTILRALSIIVISLLFIFMSLFVLLLTEKVPFLIVLFEAVSAFGTVGLSMGLTPELTDIGKQIIILMMFIGRVGPLTLAFTIAKPKRSAIRYPADDIFTG
ncbi:TrkH family potassium uptake protein [Alteribacillus sp. YIM 98480]|uniref:TrkH family potassium uptake protein n=1 Tax=Alteribacillus sp. YIM 98480 TaxID=2606599 RepID=UPI00131CC7F8|nr:TrkH family potassium uptake protein [Alteribacillus sp. YIM 98480]